MAGHWDRALEVCADAASADGALPHARAVGTGIGGLIHAFRGSAATARRDLLAATSLATRIELTAMELLSAWGLCVLDDAAGAPEAAVARARRILARWQESGERHYTIAIAAVVLHALRRGRRPGRGAGLRGSPGPDSGGDGPAGGARRAGARPRRDGIPRRRA